MKQIVLEAQTRTLQRKSVLKALRRSGQVPAIVYGGSDPPCPVVVDGAQFLQAMRTGLGENVLLSLKIGGETTTAIVKAIQRDPITRKALHVDFQRVSLKEKLEVAVPLKVIGEAPGVKLTGGVLEYILRDLSVRCLPMEIPEFIPVDVSQLEIGHGVLVRDLPIPQEIEVLTAPDQLVVNIVAPTVLEETPVEAAPAAAEPEVIARGKKPEEGEEAPPGAAPGTPPKVEAAKGAPTASRPAPEAKKESR
ncbi:MAG: 50S ribosomal protein L25 [Elusimicrobia bacterium]|nr:50S ribosomal protein L25 [Elusimicrobiota bacterium]